MKFKIIASGSKGNMTYVETNETKILIDAGIAYNRASLALIEDNIDLSEIDLILCTHEHTDHVGGLISILRKSNASLYITEKSYASLRDNIKCNLDLSNVKFIEANSKYTFKDLNILTLQMSHDSADCLGYILNSNNKTLVYATDTGIINIEYLKYLSLADALIIEANHNIEMLQESRRPEFLIRRILSVKGHLSNQLTCSILNNVLTDKQKYVVLAHISEDCNSIECITTEILEKIEFKGKILIADQYQPLELLEL